MTPPQDPLRTDREVLLDALAGVTRYWEDEQREAIGWSQDRLTAAAQPIQSEPGLEACWFCKGRFAIDALIAGYDTWEEQRLACLACNERMSGNWHATPEPDLAR